MKNLTTAKLEDVVGMAFQDIEELASEIRDTVDNATEAQAATQRMQTLGETADTLENWTDPPEIPNIGKELPVTYPEHEVRELNTRAKRRDAAVEKLDACVQAIHEWLEVHDEFKEKEEYSDMDSLADNLEGAKGEWEYVDFPGFGRSG